MFKFISIFALLYIACAAAQTRCRYCPFASEMEGRNCIQDEEGRNCRIISSCQYEEENCRLRMVGRPGVIATHMSTCHNVGPSGATAPCGPFNCREMYCIQDNEQIKCHQARNGCKLMTYCQMLRENRCRRTPQDQLRKVADGRCRGMRAGQDLRPCTN